MAKIEILTVLISFLALGASAAALLCSVLNAGTKSNEIEPQKESVGKIGVQKISAGNDRFDADATEFEFSIAAKDDLNRAYIIYANNRVEELDLDDIENILARKTERGLTSTPDIKCGRYEYRYSFLYLEGSEDPDELFLIYTKTDPHSSEETKLMIDAISGIEVYGLGNECHEDAEEYTGEKIMAEEYVRILSELPKYMAQ